MEEVQARESGCPSTGFATVQSSAGSTIRCDGAAGPERRLLARYPEVRAALMDLAGKISDQEMRKMNYAVDGEHRDSADVARDFLHSKGLE